MKKIFLSLLVACLSTPAFAIKVLTIKNNRILLNSEGETLNVGDKFIARDGDGKAKAIFEINQVKNERALGTVLKGRMATDLSIAPYAPTTSSGAGGRKAVANKSSIGFMAGYAMNSMTVKPNGSSSISLSGTSFNLSGMYQMTVDGGFGARILAGYETLVAKGDSAAAACSSSTSCEVDISYLGLEALGKYAFGASTGSQFWVGAGLGFLVAMSKSSNILDTSKISTNQTIVGALGYDWRLSPTTFIPLQFDYAIYPDNATSSATQMILRAGYGFAF